MTFNARDGNLCPNFLFGIHKAVQICAAFSFVIGRISTRSFIIRSHKGMQICAPFEAFLKWQRQTENRVLFSILPWPMNC
jgi:hypothetical protein